MLPEIFQEALVKNSFVYTEDEFDILTTGKVKVSIEGSKLFYDMAEKGDTATVKIMSGNAADSYNNEGKKVTSEPTYITYIFDETEKEKTTEIDDNTKTDVNTDANADTNADTNANTDDNANANTNANTSDDTKKILKNSIEDSTTATNILPQTGVKGLIYILVLQIIIILLTIFSFIKLKKYYKN